MASRAKSEGCEIDMTPMIDIVFQLIIFFVVTLKFTSDVNMDIVLEDGKHGEVMTADKMPPTMLEIEVDRRGNISISNFRYSETMMRTVLKNRVNRLGPEFPVMIRADKRTPHDQVKKVMDICTESGIWKLSFVAIQEKKTQGSK